MHEFWKSGAEPTFPNRNFDNREEMMPKTRKVFRKGTYAFVREEPSTSLERTPKGGFGVSIDEHADGSKTVTRRQGVIIKPIQKARRDLGDKGSKINTKQAGRNVRAHGIGDRFGGPPSESNLTFTSLEANKLDSFVEAKMATRMKSKPGSQHFMTVTEEITPTGARASKTTILQRPGSPTQMRCNVITKHEK